MPKTEPKYAQLVQVKGTVAGKPVDVIISFNSTDYAALVQQLIKSIKF